MFSLFPDIGSTGCEKYHHPKKETQKVNRPGVHIIIFPVKLRFFYLYPSEICLLNLENQSTKGMETAADYLEIDATIASQSLVLLYCSQPMCNVCKSLLPKVEDLLKKYKKVKSLYVNLDDIQEFAGQHTVFNMPTVLFFAEGKEQFRLVRSFGLNELDEKIEKIYKHF